MYTWNWKTGHLDRFSSLVGLDLAGWILSPGRWLQSNIDEFWNRYVYLVGVRQENEDLTARIKDLETELARTAEKAKAADRLTALLRFNPEPPWSKRGCRVIGQKLGPNAILETMLVDVGSAHGIRFNDPVISTKGGGTHRQARSALFFGCAPYRFVQPCSGLDQRWACASHSPGPGARRFS